MPIYARVDTFRDLVRTPVSFSALLSFLEDYNVSQESISVVLPLKDAQSWLARGTEELLECLTDLSVPFEVLLVDNGSVDFTAEIVDDLSRVYPQVRYLRLAVSHPVAEAAQRGVERSTGEIIFVQELSAPIRVTDLLKLWGLRTDRTLVMARAQTSARRVDEQWLQRLMPWSKKFSDTWNEGNSKFAGLQMLRRSGLKSLRREIPEGRIEVAHLSHQAIATPKFVDSLAYVGGKGVGIS